MRIAKLTIGMTVLVGALLALTVPALAAEFSAETEWNGKGENQVIELPGSPPAICSAINLAGVSPKNTISPTALVKPKYEGCQSKVLGLKENIEVFAHECEYETLNAKGTTKFISEANLVNCPAGIQAKFKGGCEVVIPEQTSGEAGFGANLKTEPGSFESEASAGLSGFKYTATEKCHNIGIESGKEGKYKGTAIIKGLIAVAAEVTATPTEVKLGNVTKGSRAIEYTNKGSTPWVVSPLVYTVKTGSSKAVETKNECAGLTLKAGEKCSVTINYEVPVAENYKAEVKLGTEAPVVIVKATT